MDRNRWRWPWTGKADREAARMEAAQTSAEAVAAVVSARERLEAVTQEIEDRRRGQNG